MRMAVFMIMEPLQSIQPLEIQETPGLPAAAVEIVVESGDSLVISLTTVPGTIASPLSLVPCLYRHGPHGQRTGAEISWVPQCVPVDFDAQYGVAYRVTVSRDGRQRATASTVVPGDFEIVEAAIEGNPPRRVSAAWTRSSGAYRYLVALGGIESTAITADCEQPSCVRWFAVTQDTTIATGIDARYVEHTRPPYAVKVWAVSRELFDALMTGATSGVFPIPPAQNVSGGLGTIGAWVPRWWIVLHGVEFQNSKAGVRLVNTSDSEISFSVGQFPSTSCTVDATFCGTLSSGETTMVPRGDIPTTPGIPDVVIGMCRESNLQAAAQPCW